PSAPAPDPLPAGGVDFSWTPNRPALVAGAPAGGVQFTAPSLNGATYEWDFDYDPAQGFRPSANGPAPRHGFTADSAHDTDKVNGADGQRRRVYEVRLRVRTADGAVAETSHQLVVVPNNAPRVDFTTDRENQSAATPVTLTPQFSDPDATSRTADAIDHIEWDFDGTLGDAAGADLVCDASGGACRAPGGGVPGPWLAEGRRGTLTVNFFDRELASHQLRPVGQIDVQPLATTGERLSPALAQFGGAGLLAVQLLGKRVKFFVHDPRVSFLYDNATKLQQSSFNADAGEATGATLKTAAPRRVRAAKRRAKAKKAASPVDVPSTTLRWRQVTLTAVDSAGLRASVTHELPLTPGVPPKLRAEFEVPGPGAIAAPVTGPGRQPFAAKRSAKAAKKPKAKAAAKRVLPYPLTTDSTLSYDTKGTTDPDGDIAYYTLEVGRPYFTAPDCIATPKAPQYDPEVSFDLPPPGIPDPGNIIPVADPIATGPASPVGATGNIALPNLNVRPSFALRAGAPLPTLASLPSPYIHPCLKFAARNVVPTTFTSLAGGTPKQVRAIVTRNPADLRFKMPATDINDVYDTGWSVSVGVYDNSGMGAIQRTDGFKITNTKTLTCQVVSGLPLKVSLGSGKSRTVAASSQCADITPQLKAFYTTKDVSLNGIILRPRAGSAIVVDSTAGIWATKKPRPSLNGSEATVRSRLKRLAGGGDVDVLVDGEAVARLEGLSAQSFKSLLRGPNRDGSYPVQPRLVDGARFHGSPISRSGTGVNGHRDFHIDFSGGDCSDTACSPARSRTEFSIVLPKEFSTSETGAKSPTALIVRNGVEELNATELDTNGFADIASNSRGPKARAASASPSTIDLSHTSLGPVTIDEGKMTFDPARGLFDGNIEKARLEVGDGAEASLHILIDGGELRSASGGVKSNTGVPLFPGVTLNAVRFSIVTDPLTIKGGADFQAAKLLTGSLDLLVRPDPFLLRLDGTVSVGGEVKLGSAYVQYDASNHNNLTFGGRIGVDLGPVSVGGGVDGGFSGDTGDFFVQGEVHVCVGICADGKVLVSNQALAACAEIEVGLVTVGAGFAYRFSSGLPGGLDLFTGCDLTPYIPAVFRTRAGATVDVRAVTKSDLVVKPDTEQVAFRFRANPAAPSAPAITLTGPDGRTYSTRKNDYVFVAPAPVALAGKGVSPASGALIDQDPVDKVSTFLITKPTPGAWKVTQAAGEPPLASVDSATGEHVAASEIGGDVVDADPLKDGARIDDTRYAERGTAAAPTSSTRRVRPLRDVSDGAPIEDGRMRGIVIKVPTGLDGKMTIVDAGPTTNQTLTEIDLDANSGKQIPLTFTPAADAGRHEIKALLEHPDGTPRSVLSVDGYVAPGIPAPRTPSVSAKELRRDRLSVIVNTGLTASLSDPAARLNLVAVSPAGQRVERLITARDARRLSPGRYQVTLDDFDTTGRVRVLAQMVYAGKAGGVARVIARPRG
ncbi:MAG: hypothetical protein JHC95_17095, partial [Solirubrobacteraceae bacterium]|nr:hypothetical protein [Solirubrobacteraceae bacterium]